MERKSKYYWYCLNGNHPYVPAWTVGAEKVNRRVFCRDCDCHTLQISKLNEVPNELVEKVLV